MIDDPVSRGGSMVNGAKTANNRSRRFGWLLVVGSMVGLTIGIGVGLRGLRAGHLAVPVLLGLLVLLAAVVSLAVGMTRVLAGRTAWVRIVGGIFLAIGVGAVVWTLTPAVIASYVPQIDHDGASPSEFGIEASEVSFLSADGAELWAWYVAPQNGRAVIVRHGSGSTAGAVLGHAKVLVTHGYGVLLTDARGHGNSGGQGMDFGWSGDEDIAAALDFLEGRPGVDPGAISVLGLSMGGEEAVGAIGHDARIAAVVAEGATARTDTDKEWLSDVYGWRGWIQEQLEAAQYAVTDLLTPASKPDSLASSARRADPRPILMIAGGEVPDEAHAAAHISSSAPNVEVWVVSGAGHIAGLSVEPDKWEEVVIGFLEALEGNR